jgi:hypothetical protein
MADDNKSWVEKMIEAGSSWIHNHFPDVSKEREAGENGKPAGDLKSPQQIADDNS